MGQLKTHDLPDLVGLVPEDPKTSNAMRTLPGDPVRHKDDANSYGMILSRRWGPNDKPMQCEVLWSREPYEVKVQVQTIQAKSRVLKARWTAEEADTLVVGDLPKFFKRETQRFEGEETYDPVEANTTDLLKMMNEPDVKEIKFNMDGSAVVHRRAHSERELPDYLREPDGSIRSLTYHRK